MSTTFVYTLGVDLPSQVDIGALHESISTALPANNSYITLSGTSLTVKFTTSLSGGDETTLANIISQYNYSAPTVREYFEYPIQILDTTNAVQSGTTGALMVNGGAFITKDLYAANLYMGSERVATETYVSGTALIFGTGLTKTGNTVTVNSILSHVTSVGTLSSLTVSGTAIAQSTPTSSTHITNKGYVDSLSYLTAGTGLTLVSGILSVNANQTQITTVGTLSSLSISGALSGSTATFSGTVTADTPILTSHLTTKSYVDTLGYLTAGTGLTKTASTLSVNASQTQITAIGTLSSLSVSGTATFTSTVTVPTPVNSTDATTKSYVDTLGYLTAGTGLTKTASTLSVNASQTQITTVGTLTALNISGTLNGSTASFTGNVSVPTAPTLGSHVVNKDYVDSIASGISAKTSVVAASTTSVTLSAVIAGTTLDGVTLVLGNRILLKNQTSAIENGIYLVQSSASPIRSPDFATGADISGTFVFVEGGTINASSGWVTTNTSGGDIVGTNAINWVQFSGTGQVTAGNGLSKTGNVLDVNVDNTSLEIVADTLRISSGALGTGLSGGSGTTISVNASQPQITTIGTLTSLTISGALSGSTSTFTGTVTGATPTLSTHLTTKAYVDGLAYLTAGTGLTKTSSTLSVNASQTQITTVGTLTSLSVSGATTLTSGTASTTTSTGTLVVSGGIGVSGQVTATTLVGTLQTASQPNITSVGTLSSLTISGALSGSTATFSGVVIGATPSLSTHLTTKAYVDAISYITAGTGLTKTSSTLSVNASQTQITSVGTLTGLSVSGATTLTAGTASTTTSTGTLVVSGGIGVSGQVTASTLSGTMVTAAQGNITSVGTLTSLTVSGALGGSTASFTGTVTGATPTLSTHLTTKAYVDSLTYLTAGTGLTLATGTLSVNTSQPQITSIGTLTTLNVSGTSTFSGTVTVPTPTNVTDATNKTYVDSISYITAGTGLTKTSSTLSVNASQPQITTIGTLSSLAISGSLSGTTASFSGAVSIPTAPTLGSHAVNKDYVDSIASGISAKAAVVAASTTTVTLASITVGSTLDGVTLASGNRVLLKNQASATENGIYVVQPSGAPVRSSDFATGADISGTFVFVEGGTTNASSGWVTTNTSGGDIVGTNAINWVQFSGAGQITAGNGLSKTGNTLDVNVDGISLEISADTLRISSGALGTGLSGGSGTVISVNASQPQITSVGTLTSLVISGTLGGTTATFSGVVIGATPTLASHLTTKAYVDAISYVTAGTGLTKTGSTLSVNASQTQITSVGTLTGLSVSGATTLTAGTASTTTSTGTLIVTGGIGVSGQVTAINLSGTIVTASQGNITSLGTLTGLSVSGLASFTNTTEATATNTASVTIAGGLGIAKRLFVGGDIVYPSACKIISNTVDEGDTGSLMLSGGGDAIAPRGGYIQMYGQQHATNPGQLVLGSTTITGSIIMQTAGTNRVTVNLAGDMTVLNGTSSNSTNTGALVVTGGLGVGGAINTTTLSATSGITGTLQTSAQGNVTSVGTLTSLEVSGTTQMGGVVTITNTTDSTTTSTGALVVSGGVAVAKNLELGAGISYKTRLISTATTLTLADNAVAVSTTTGSVTVTLPPAVAGTEGFEVKIAKVTGDTNSLVIAPQSGESIGGAVTGSWTLTSLYASIQLISIGNGKWGIIAIQDPLNSNLSSQTSSSLGDPVWSNSATGATDGTVTISSNTSLTRDMYYLNLTVNNGVTLTSNGWRIFVYGTLTLNGKISNDGGSASGATAGIAPLTNHLGGGTNGGAGRTGSGNSNAGVASATANFLGGRGGQSFATGTGRNGALGGVITYLAESDGGSNIMASFPYSLMGRCTGAGATGLCGGTGGAGGPLERGITLTGNSGGGGAGAGAIIVAARTITGTGSITANGGNGGNAAFTGSLGVTASLCGGGGGGGGVVSVFYRFNSSSVIFTANGGNGGIAQGNGTDGAAGEAGVVYVNQV